jgi:hypothetical protein
MGPSNGRSQPARGVENVDRAAEPSRSHSDRHRCAPRYRGACWRRLVEHLVIPPVERSKADVVQAQAAVVDAFCCLDALHAYKVRNENRLLGRRLTPHPTRRTAPTATMATAQPVFPVSCTWRFSAQAAPFDRSFVAWAGVRECHPKAPTPARRKVKPSPGCKISAEGVEHAEPVEAIRRSSPPEGARTRRG